MGEEQVAVEEGETTRVEFVLRVMPRVAGTVRDDVGNPLAGVKIQVIPSVHGGVSTDTDGKFAMSWDSALWKWGDTRSVLVARDLAHNLAETVEVDERTDNLDLRLRPAGILTGTVLNQEGKPLPGARLLVNLLQSERGMPSGLVEQATAGANGTFEIKGIPPGRRYEITAMADGYGTQEVDVYTSNRADDRQDLGQFRLPWANLSISGVVVDSQGQPVEGARVSIVDGSLPPRGSVQTNGDGKFVLTGVPAGSIQVTADTRGPKYMHGYVRANGGATGVRIVVSE